LSKKPFDGLVNINKRKDNRLVILETSGIPVTDTCGNLIGYRGIDRNITERKRIEDALKRSEERYKTLVENQGEGIGLVSEQEEFLYANPAAERIFGVLPGTLVGRNLKDFLTKENYMAVREQTKLRQKGKISTYEVDIIQPSGKTRSLLVTASPEFDDKNRFKNTFGIFRDISEQKRMQEEILKSKKFESLGILTAGIAHDFNNLLTIISGNLELTKKKLVNEDNALKFLLKSEKKVYEAAELVKRFLVFSESKSMMVRIESIRKIIQNSIDQALSDSNIICSSEIPDELWPVECNVDQIFYTITNLLLNAKEASSSKGKIRIIASNEDVMADEIRTLKAGKYIKLAIQDYGTGISEEDLANIFDPYFTTKDKRTEKGLGLGLTTIYSIMIKHKGYINVISEKGVGTTVEIYLPALTARKS
jgi:PAS domain S-box-containing protein